MGAWFRVERYRLVCQDKKTKKQRLQAPSPDARIAYANATILSRQPYGSATPSLDKIAVHSHVPMHARRAKGARAL
jgi:hypothetical protein